LTIHVVSFSGGKDSTCMLLMMIEKKMPIHQIIFVDTTKEFPDMYKHIEEVKEYIKPLKIKTATMDYDYWFRRRRKTKTKRPITTGYGFPGVNSRWCTKIKIRAIHSMIMTSRYDPHQQSRFTLPSYVTQYVGIASDEYKRINEHAHLRYPLVEWGVTEEEALEYCYDKGFTWNGLYTKFKRVSCYCCPLQPLSELYTLYKEYPDLWWQLEEMSKYSSTPFKDTTVNRLATRFFNRLEAEK